MFQHIDAFNRHKGAWAEDQFKLTVRRVLHLEAAYNRDFRYSVSLGRSSTPEAGSVRLSPVDTLNLIFEGARLPVRFELTGDGLSAAREGATYSIEAMSDGERAALFIVSAIVSQPPGAVVLIDEPEKHLHPSITSLLLDACVRSRPDLAVVVSSHDALLIERLSPTNVIHIRNSTVAQVRPETRVFDANIVNNIVDIPEDLRAALLGSRSEVLFVEGDNGSNDLALYSHVYEGVRVLARGGHSKVQEAVLALRALGEQHWLKPYGIIDGDGRNSHERQALAAKSIFALPCPSIENVFFFDEMIRCFVFANTIYSGGLSLDERIAAVAKQCIAVAARDRVEIIARRASWLLERRLSEAKLSPSAMTATLLQPITIDLNQIKRRRERR